MGEMRNTRTILVGKSEGKRPLERTRRRWEDKTGMDLREIIYKVTVWNLLAQYREQWLTLVNTVLNLLVP
jgi:hypothetical protein